MPADLLRRPLTKVTLLMVAHHPSLLQSFLRFIFFELRPPVTTIIAFGLAYTPWAATALQHRGTGWPFHPNWPFSCHRSRPTSPTSRSRVAPASWKKIKVEKVSSVDIDTYIYNIPIESNRIEPSPILSYLILTYLILSDLVWSYLILSYLILSIYSSKCLHVRLIQGALYTLTDSSHVAVWNGWPGKQMCAGQANH